MSDTNKPTPGNEAADAKLREGIAYFEQMLQAMPKDRMTLEFLAVAYNQANEPEKCREALIRLTGTLIDEGDLDAAERIADRLETYAEADARAMALKVRALRAPAPTLVPEAPPAPAESDVATALREGIKAELALLDTLAARQIVDEKTLLLARSQLSELPVGDHPFMVSAIAAIDRENSAAGQAATVFASDASGAPPIPLGAFAPSAELIRTVPEPLARVRGVIPFAKLGDTVLVATPNPLDDALKLATEKAIGSPCRFFFGAPAVAETIAESAYAPS